MEQPKKKEKREMEALDYGMFVIWIVGGIVILIGFIKGFTWIPWTGGLPL